MKKVFLTESELKKFIYETAKRVISNMNEGKRPYPTDEWGNYRSPRWNDETLDFMEYDTDAESAGIEEMVNRVMKELSNPYTVKKATRMTGLRYSQRSLENFFSEDARNHYSNALRYYLSPKSKETGEPTYVCALKFQEMSPEEQASDVARYVQEKVKGEYGTMYDRYKSDFDYQSKIRQGVDKDVETFMGNHGGLTPESVASMSYVDLVNLDKELKNIGVQSAYGNRDTYRGRYYYDDILKHLNRGQLKELIAAVDAEIRKRRDSVKHYDIGYLNKFDPHYNTSKEEYDEWEELQALIKKYKNVNTGGTSNNRGDNSYWGEIVDENGELVALYDYKVDSSD